MSSFEIIGGKKLKGEIIPQGAKNEALQILCAPLLTDQEVIISNVPNILDVNKLLKLLIFFSLIFFSYYTVRVQLLYLIFCTLSRMFRKFNYLRLIKHPKITARIIRKIVNKKNTLDYATEKLLNRDFYACKAPDDSVLRIEPCIVSD